MMADSLILLVVCFLYLGQLSCALGNAPNGSSSSGPVADKITNDAMALERRLDIVIGPFKIPVGEDCAQEAENLKAKQVERQEAECPAAEVSKDSKLWNQKVLGLGAQTCDSFVGFNLGLHMKCPLFIGSVGGKFEHIYPSEGEGVDIVRALTQAVLNSFTAVPEHVLKQLRTTLSPLMELKNNIESFLVEKVGDRVKRVMKDNPDVFVGPRSRDAKWKVTLKLKIGFPLMNFGLTWKLPLCTDEDGYQMIGVNSGFVALATDGGAGVGAMVGCRMQCAQKKVRFVRWSQLGNACKPNKYGEPDVKLMVDFGVLANTIGMDVIAERLGRRNSGQERDKWVSERERRIKAVEDFGHDAGAQFLNLPTYREQEEGNASCLVM